jgi:hypothetical protein
MIEPDMLAAVDKNRFPSLPEAGNRLSMPAWCSGWRAILDGGC